MNESKLKSLFKKASPIIKMELDVKNVALAKNGATVFIDGVEQPASPINDGIRAHINKYGEVINENVEAEYPVWEPTHPLYFKDDFNFLNPNDWNFTKSGEGSYSASGGNLILYSQNSGHSEINFLHRDEFYNVWSNLRIKFSITQFNAIGEDNRFVKFVISDGGETGLFASYRYFSSGWKKRLYLVDGDGIENFITELVEGDYIFEVLNMPPAGGFSDIRLIRNGEVLFDVQQVNFYVLGEEIFVHTEDPNDICEVKIDYFEAWETQ